jgi:hypothetical protein
VRSRRGSTISRRQPAGGCLEVGPASLAWLSGRRRPGQQSEIIEHHGRPPSGSVPWRAGASGGSARRLGPSPASSTVGGFGIGIRGRTS